MKISIRPRFLALGLVILAGAGCAQVGSSMPQSSHRSRNTPMLPIGASEEGQYTRGSDVGLPQQHELPENRGTSRGSN